MCLANIRQIIKSPTFISCFAILPPSGEIKKENNLLRQTKPQINICIYKKQFLQISIIHTACGCYIRIYVDSVPNWHQHHQSRSTSSPCNLEVCRLLDVGEWDPFWGGSSPINRWDLSEATEAIIIAAAAAAGTHGIDV